MSKLSALGRTTPIAYHDDVKMQNGSNGGDGSGQIILKVVQPSGVEESGMLEPQLTLQTIPMQPQVPKRPILLFDGSRIFVHAPQFHWHAAATEGIPAVDQDVRDHLVSIADL